jgi:uncharacterized membrane protein
MRKWLPLLVVLAGFLLSAAAYPRLPHRVAFPADALLPVVPPDASETLPRAVAAFGLPVLALALWGLMHDAPVRATGRLAARLFPEDARGPWSRPGADGAAAYARYASTYRLTVLWVVALVLAIHGEMLASALDWPVTPGRIVGLTFAAGLLGVGNVLPRLRPNAVAGIRTARTLRDPQLWARVHRRYGTLWVAGGALVLVSALVAPRYALLVGTAALLGASLAMLAGGRLLGLVLVGVGAALAGANGALA